jgi:hypothetical protein
MAVNVQIMLQSHTEAAADSMYRHTDTELQLATVDAHM